MAVVLQEQQPQPHTFSDDVNDTNFDWYKKLKEH